MLASVITKGRAPQELITHKWRLWRKHSKSLYDRYVSFFSFSWGCSESSQYYKVFPWWSEVEPTLNHLTPHTNTQCWFTKYLWSTCTNLPHTQRFPPKKCLLPHLDHPSFPSSHHHFDLPTEACLSNLFNHPAVSYYSWVWTYEPSVSFLLDLQSLVSSISPSWKILTACEKKKLWSRWKPCDPGFEWYDKKSVYAKPSAVFERSWSSNSIDLTIWMG